MNTEVPNSTTQDFVTLDWLFLRYTYYTFWLRYENIVLSLWNSEKLENQKYLWKVKVPTHLVVRNFVVYFAKISVLNSGVLQVRAVFFFLSKFCQAVQNFKSSVVLPRSRTKFCQNCQISMTENFNHRGGYKPFCSEMFISVYMKTVVKPGQPPLPGNPFRDSNCPD